MESDWFLYFILQTQFCLLCVDNDTIIYFAALSLRHFTGGKKIGNYFVLAIKTTIKTIFCGRNINRQLIGAAMALNLQQPPRICSRLCRC